MDKTESKKVFIYSIPRETATKVSDFTSDVSGKKLKKTKIGRCRDAIQAEFSPRVGGLQNGLSYKPWMVDGKQVEDSEGKKLTLQDKLEQKWGLDSNTLHNRAWRKGDSLREADMSYYQTKSWKLNDGCTVLDLSNMDDELFYYAALDHKFIANSEREWKSHKWPKATHYIAIENEAEELRYSRNKVRSQAYAKLEDNKTLTQTMRVKFIAILGLANAGMAKELSEEQRHNLLYNHIETSSFLPGSKIDKFNELYQLAKTAPGKIEIEARYLLARATDARVIYEKQGSYNWVRPKGTIVLGETYSEAIQFLMNPKKEALVEELEKTIEAKRL